MLCIFIPVSVSVSLPVPLSTQPVKADGRPPAARVCPRFLPVKGEFFLATVANGGNVGSLYIDAIEFGLYLLYLGKRLEITSVMIWRYTNKVELN